MQSLIDLLFWWSPIPAWIVDQDSMRFLAVNDAALESYGYDRDEFLAMTSVALCLGRERDGSWKNITRDGTIVHVEESASEVFLYEGASARLTIAHDVSERHTHGEYVASVGSMHEIAQHIASLGSWTLDLRTRKTSYSAECARLFPWDLSDVNWVHLLQYCLLDGQTETAALLHRAARDQNDFDVDARLRTTDGARWYHIALRELRDDAGVPTRHVGVLLDIEERRATVERLERIAFFDEATGLPNRASLVRTLEAMRLTDGAALLIARFEPTPSSAVLPDDVAIATLARLNATLVAGCTIARFSEQMFVVVFPSSDGAQAARLWARLAVRAFEAALVVGEKGVVVKLTLGIASTIAGNAGGELLIAARTALDSALLQGIDCVEYSEPVRVGVLRRTSVDSALRDAIRKGELHMVYQPVVSTSDSRVVSIEALMRWESSLLGIVGPDEFIAIAEETGYIGRLGEWALDRAFADFASLRRERRPCLMINIAPRQLRERDFFEDVMAKASAHGVGPHEFGIELTERTMIHDLPGAATRVLQRLRAVGVRVALDDFGTGYSSMRYLSSLPIDQIKIDRSFVAAMSDDRYTRSLIRTIIDLAGVLDLTVVAEGVEQPADAAALAKMGCHALQGYLLAKPMRIEALGTFLVTQSRAEQFVSRTVPTKRLQKKPLPRDERAAVVGL